jgi:hypothetical protein
LAEDIAEKTALGYVVESTLLHSLYDGLDGWMPAYHDDLRKQGLRSRMPRQVNCSLGDPVFRLLAWAWVFSRAYSRSETAMIDVTLVE